MDCFAVAKNSFVTVRNVADAVVVHIVAQRLPSAIAGGRGGWIAVVESEGTRPALLFAGPVPERWNVKSAFIETSNGPAISWTSWLALFLVFKNAFAFQWLRYEYFFSCFKNCQCNVSIIIGACNGNLIKMLAHEGC